MDKNIQMEEDIVRFLEGDMNEEECKIFESRLESEPQLQKLLLEYRTIIEGIEFWGDEQVRSSINKIQKDLEEKNFFKNGKSVSSGGRSGGNLISMNGFKYLIAAAILIAVSTTVFIWLTPDKLNGSELFANYNKLDREQLKKDIERFNVSGLISGMQAEDTIKQALIYLESGNFTESLKLLENFNVDKPGIPIVQYYLGLNHLNLGRFDKSGPIFKSLCSQKSFELASDACWYYALQLIHNNADVELAKSILSDLSSRDTYNRAAEAKNLLSKLEH